MKENIPYAIEEEKKVLSGMWLKGGEVIPAVAGIISADDFYRVEHRIIFAATLKVYETAGQFDFLSLVEELRLTKQLERVNHRYLLDLIDYEFTTSRAERYAKVIREKSVRRQMMELGDLLKEKASEDIMPTEELLDLADKKMQEMTTLGNKPLDDLQTVLIEQWEQIKLRGRNSDELLGISTGLTGLDRRTQGLKNSDLIILAARPSMGKTALALNIATTAALKVPTLMFSLEMSKSQLADRIISSTSHVVNSRIQSGDLTDGEQMAILDAIERSEKLQLRIDDTGGLTLSEIRMRSKHFRHQYGLGLIVVDYIQLIQASREYRGNRVQEVSEISRGLKALAKELDIPILALSQLSRSVELRADKKPQLSDLRESGSIEQDADIVMFLYREAYYDRDNADETLAELIVAKNRNGSTGTVRLKFEPAYTLFSNLACSGV